VKADTSRPLRYGAVVAVLLLFRVWDYLRTRKIGGKLKAKKRPAIAQELDGA
jgi:DMSO/TMAO reductase YedYZ heme-binding membrane subunit